MILDVVTLLDCAAYERTYDVYALRLDFDESKIKRDEGGQFASKEGSSSKRADSGDEPGTHGRGNGRTIDKISRLDDLPEPMRRAVSNNEDRVSDLYEQSEELQDAVDHYTSSGYQRLNETLRKGADASMDDDDYDTMTSLDSLFDQLDEFDEPITTFRGLGPNSSRRILDRVRKMDWENEEVFDEAFVSTSLDPSVATNPAFTGGQVLVQMKVKKGAAFESITGGGENEILLPRDGSYRVEGIDEDVELGFDKSPTKTKWTVIRLIQS